MPLTEVARIIIGNAEKKVDYDIPALICVNPKCELFKSLFFKSKTNKPILASKVFSYNKIEEYSINHIIRKKRDFLDK